MVIVAIVAALSLLIYLSGGSINDMELLARSVKGGIYGARPEPREVGDQDSSSRYNALGVVLVIGLFAVLLAAAIYLSRLGPMF